MIRLLIRRTLSGISRATRWTASRLRGLYFRAACPGLELSSGVEIGPGVRLSATDGGRIAIGSNVSLGPHCQIVARRGGRIRIGENVQLGQGCIVTALDGIAIGPGCLLAEYVVIRDQDHDSGSRPFRHSGFKTAAIEIGDDCWLGTKSTVLRGSVIGRGAVIGAHALVRSAIPGRTLAVGSPARVVKQFVGLREREPS
ncbi:MAG: acyltransferase [Methylococcaceae bacterium]|nr:acyltransferase [Methylococcaceae bacterium]